MLVRESFVSDYVEQKIDRNADGSFADGELAHGLILMSNCFVYFFPILGLWIFTNYVGSNHAAVLRNTVEMCL